MKRNHNTAELSPLTPLIQANFAQAAGIRRKINTLDTDAPDDIKNRFLSINNILNDNKGALWPHQQQPQTQIKRGPHRKPPISTKAAPAEPITTTNAVEPGPEEHQRLRSIVFIGLPENNATTRSARQQADQATAVKLLDELGVEAAPTDCYRLGRFPNQAGSGPRLLRLSLPSPKFKWIALGQWKMKRMTIRAQPGFDRLLIRPSMTAAQRAEEKQQATPAQSPRPADKPEEASTTSSIQPEEETTEDRQKHGKSRRRRRRNSHRSQTRCQNRWCRTNYAGDAVVPDS